MWILLPNIYLQCFAGRKFLSQVDALFGGLFTGSKNVVVYQKWQIWGMMAEFPVLLARVCSQSYPLLNLYIFAPSGALNSQAVQRYPFRPIQSIQPMSESQEDASCLHAHLCSIFVHFRLSCCKPCWKYVTGQVSVLVGSLCTVKRCTAYMRFFCISPRPSYFLYGWLCGAVLIACFTILNSISCIFAIPNLTIMLFPSCCHKMYTSPNIVYIDHLTDCHIREIKKIGRRFKSLCISFEAYFRYQDVSSHTVASSCPRSKLWSLLILASNEVLHSSSDSIFFVLLFQCEEREDSSNWTGPSPCWKRPPSDNCLPNKGKERGEKFSQGGQ